VLPERASVVDRPDTFAKVLLVDLLGYRAAADEGLAEARGLLFEERDQL
jgi:hypothetical protein